MVALSESASALNLVPRSTTHGQRPQRGRGGGRPGERDRVLTVRAGPVGRRRCPTTSCSAPSGRMPRVDDLPDGQLGQVRGRGRRFDDGRQPGEQRGRQLLEHAPDREVERVDEHGDDRAGRCRRSGRRTRRRRAGAGRPRRRPCRRAGRAAPGGRRRRASGCRPRRPPWRRPGCRRPCRTPRATRPSRPPRYSARSRQQRGPLVEGQRPQRRPADRAGVVDQRRACPGPRR